MNKREFLVGLIIVISAAFSSSGCQPRSTSKTEAGSPFVFRSLDLSQRRKDGLRDWDLTSPEARYDLTSRTIRARGPKGVLYQNDQPAYSISADLATVLQDGELMVLEGSVLLRRLNERPLLIKGDRLIWNPERSQMVINQRPQADDGSSRIQSRSVTFLPKENQLTFSGPPQIDRWDGPFKPDTPPTTRSTGTKGSWNLETGVIAAAGPIQAKQRSGQQLKASRVEGNTRKGFLDLVQPVVLTLEKNRGTVQAGLTRWEFNNKRLISTEPVRATLKQGTVQGSGFNLNQGTNTVIIPANCSFRQADQSLKADRCSWNWETELVVADGDVVLVRKNPDKVTRAPRMEATIGDEGEVRFGGAGERVKSSIQLKPNPNDKPRRSPVTF